MLNCLEPTFASAVPSFSRLTTENKCSVVKLLGLGVPPTFASEVPPRLPGQSGRVFPAPSGEIKGAGPD